VKPGIISPSVFQWSDGHPVRMFREVADAWEKQEGVYYVSVACGFGYADAPDAGASVIAVTNNDKDLAEKVARHVAGIMWEFKEDLARKPILKTREAVAKALDLVAKGIRPVVLADGSDRTGDNTLVLGELLRKGARNVGHSVLADKSAVKECQRAGLGATVTVKAGGWAPASGEPLTLTGKIVFLGTGDYTKTGPMQQGTTGVCGPTAVLDIGNGNYVILTTFNHQATDDAQFRAYGIDFDKIDIITLRSRVHFRAFYGKVAGAIIEVDAPGLGPADLSVFDYKRLSKDVYPVGANWRKGR
ncbi:MAG: MlrC C-terminal domain-containing protein, partial [Bacillota bacterium]|nr:MlrC C-terminal domain-containing protein [Bacillota bacterium]